MSAFINKMSYVEDLNSRLRHLGHPRPYASIAIGENWRPEYAEVLAGISANRARLDLISAPVDKALKPGNYVVWLKKHSVLYLAMLDTRKASLSVYSSDQALNIPGDTIFVSIARELGLGEVSITHKTVLDVPCWMNNAQVCFLTCGFYAQSVFPNNYTIADIYKFCCNYPGIC